MFKWLRFTTKTTTGNTVPIVVRLRDIAAFVTDEETGGTLLIMDGAIEELLITESFDTVAQAIDFASMEAEKVVVDPKTWKLLGGEEPNPWRD